MALFEETEKTARRTGTLFALLIGGLIFGLFITMVYYGEHEEDFFTALLVFLMLHGSIALNIYMLWKAPRERGLTRAGEQAISAWGRNPIFFMSLLFVSGLVVVMVYDWMILSQLGQAGLPVIGFQDPNWVENKIPLYLAFAVSFLYFWFTVTAYLFILFAEAEFGQLKSRFDAKAQRSATVSEGSFTYIRNIWVWTAAALLIGSFVILMIVAFDIVDLGVDLETVMAQAEDPAVGMIEYFADTRIIMVVLLAWGLSIMLAFAFTLTGGSGPKVQSLFGFGGLVLFVMILGLHEPFFAWLTENFGRNAGAALIGIGAGAILFFFATNFIFATVITLFTLSFAGVFKRLKTVKKDEIYAKEGLALFVTQTTPRKHRKVDQKMKRKLGRKK